MFPKSLSAKVTKNAARSGQSCACFNIRKTARIITQMYDEALRASGLRVTQFSVLMALSHLESLPLSRLATIMAMDRTTLTRNLRPLEQQGFLKIATGQDRRERQISLTQQGQRCLAKALPLWEQTQTRLAHSFGSDRLQRLFGELADLRTAGRSK